MVAFAYMSAQKTVFVIISKDVIRRNILDTAFLPTLTNGAPDARIVLVVEKGKKEAYEQKNTAPNVVIEEYERAPFLGRAARLFFFVRSGIRSYSTTFHRWNAYARGRAGFLATFIKSLLSLTLGISDFAKKALRRRLMTLSPPPEIYKLFEMYTPDVVFTPSLIDNDFDVLFALEAKRRKTRLVGMVRSWDNLNHHGLLAVVPDRFIFQNKWLTEAAERFQAIRLETLEKDIVGLPHYDIYKKNSSKRWGLIQRRKSFWLVALSTTQLKTSSRTASTSL
jgi:hypothetical protein